VELVNSRVNRNTVGILLFRNKCSVVTAPHITYLVSVGMCIFKTIEFLNI